ncbi:hypothetical protein [Microbispora sp. GKU 823]|uniref:hypothetical protein n=1 Tax=Microbispora sp. GKU 823 TaxID=1652100 RepID=UPI0009A3E1A5|nr:hypothetical protein [Microbispora sp. GKU 823]OPG05926.1 hypothetical protein B1L11_34085 [Microbispora sp. GKU 823]
MKKLLLATAVAGLAFATATVGTAASASASPLATARIGDGHGNALAEATLTDRNTVIICDRSTDHRYAMVKIRYKGHTYRYMNFYKDVDCVEQKTRKMNSGKIEFWACVSKPYKLRFARCGAKQTLLRAYKMT